MIYLLYREVNCAACSYNRKGENHEEKVLALVLAASMAASMAATVSVFAEAATATEADLPAEAQFEPNKDYDKYTVVEYTIEDIQADLVCTVSAKEDNSEFYLECNFYGDDQMTRTTYDGKEFKVEEDKTGFMAGDTPAILQKAIDQNVWVAMGDGAAADDAAADDAKADDTKEIKGVTEDKLPAEPQFEANKDYDKWTVVEYTIEDIQADLVCTVSAKEDDSEFYLECNFYGDDQMTKTTYDGKEYKVEEDKTGFMAVDTPAILDKALSRIFGYTSIMEQTQLMMQQLQMQQLQTEQQLQQQTFRQKHSSSQTKTMTSTQ